MPVNCPLCDKASINIYNTKDINRRITDEIFKYNICRPCRIIHLVNVPLDLSKYYVNDYYQIPSRKKLIKLAQKNRHKIELVKKYSSGNELLEIGPAIGVFACLASMNGFSVDVIERDSDCCKLLRDGICRTVIHSDNPEEKLKQLGNYDVITLWHVFEHLKMPFKLLESLIDKLKPGGIILIATPNPDSIQLRHMKSFWPHLDAPRHLQLVHVKTLFKELKPLNIELIKVSYRDRDGFRWNLFSWQRLLMNTVNNTILIKIAYIIGTIIGVILSPVELYKTNPAAYIAIFKKPDAY